MPRRRPALDDESLPLSTPAPPPLPAAKQRSRGRGGLFDSPASAVSSDAVVRELSAVPRRRAFHYKSTPGVIAALSLCALLVSAVVAAGGGLLNRVRGGWVALPPIGDDGVFLHDFLPRLLFAVPTALLLAVLLRRRHGAVIAPLFAVVTLFSLYVGWGTYFSMGRGEDWNSRIGVFDWFVGRAQPDWSFMRLWLRDFVAMGWRGFLQTGPVGLLLYCYGYSSLFMISGFAMGGVYAFAYIIPLFLENFEQGTALGEFIWGWWNWFLLIVAVLGARPRHTGRAKSFLPLPEDGSTRVPRCFRRVRLVVKVLGHLLLVLVGIVLIVSCVFYARVQQGDMRNRDQSLLGICIASGFLSLLHVVYLLIKAVLRRFIRRYDCTEQDAAAEAFCGSWFKPAATYKTVQQHDSDDEGRNLFDEPASRRRSRSAGSGSIKWSVQQTYESEEVPESMVVKRRCFIFTPWWFFMQFVCWTTMLLVLGATIYVAICNASFDIWNHEVSATAAAA